jgi:hypothetical protein
MSTKRQQIQWCFTIIIILMALLLSGCQSQAAPATKQPTSPADQTGEPSLTGSYVYIYETGGSRQWHRLKMFDNGTWLYTCPGGCLMNGDYTVTEDQLVLTEPSFEVSSCERSEGLQPGVYQWTLDGQTLILTPVNDPCAGRVDVMAAQWTKK